MVDIENSSLMTRDRLWHLYELDRALKLIRLGAGEEAISHGRLVLLWLQIYDRIED